MNLEKMVWKMMRFRPGFSSLSVLLFLLIHGLPLLTGFITKTLLDTLTGKRLADLNIETLLGLMITLGIIQLAAAFSKVLVETTYEYALRILLRGNMLDWLLRSSSPFPALSTQAVTYFREDVDTLIEYLQVWLKLVGHTLVSIVALVILARIHFLITLQACAPMLVIVGLTHAARLLIMRYRRNNRLATEQTTSFIGTLFSSVQMMQQTGAVVQGVEQLRHLNETRGKAAVKDSTLTSGMHALNRNVITICIGIFLLLVSHYLPGGSFTIGDFSLFIGYLKLVMDFPHVVGELLMHRQQTNVSYARLAGLLSTAPVSVIAQHRPLHLHKPAPSAPGHPA
ncbi:MAG: ABC transporter ATP-binding protein [Ktedonobacteraceae bacterium]|nr:ABC transporter ATP-binding protein [Ktedonobacteraceae bacterium]MBO0791842.1 ABC transporter ATP-binding protein [Ktedonobacteraceae bacterium]